LTPRQRFTPSAHLPDAQVVDRFLEVAMWFAFARPDCPGALPSNLLRNPMPLRYRMIM
jgi:hypothetical protein